MQTPTELLAALILSELVADPTTGSLPALRILLVPFRRHFLSRADRRKPSLSPDLPRPLADVAGCCFMNVLSLVSRDVWPTAGTTGFEITAVVLSMAFGVKESPSSDIALLHYSTEEGSDSSSDTSLSSPSICQMGTNPHQGHGLGEDDAPRSVSGVQPGSFHSEEDHQVIFTNST